jgi:hypothetical protein
MRARECVSTANAEATFVVDCLIALDRVAPCNSKHRVEPLLCGSSLRDDRSSPSETRLRAIAQSSGTLNAVANRSASLVQRHHPRFVIRCVCKNVKLVQRMFVRSRQQQRSSENAAAASFEQQSAIQIPPNESVRQREHERDALRKIENGEENTKREELDSLWNRS